MKPVRKENESDADYQKRVEAWEKWVVARGPVDPMDIVDMVSRTAPLNGASFDRKTREVDVVVSSGARVRRRDWDGEYDEVLSMKPGAIRLERFNAGAQMLDSHNYWRGMDAVLGAIIPGTARVEGGNLVGRAKISRSDGGQRIAQDLQDEIPLLLSAGYKVHKFEEDNTVSPPVRMITDWEPLEVSVVPVSAEGVGTGFRGYPDHNRGTSPANGVRKMKPTIRSGESQADFEKRLLAWHEEQEQVRATAEAAAVKKREEEALAEKTRKEEEAATKKRAEKRAAAKRKAAEKKGDDEGDDSTDDGDEGADDDEDDGKRTAEITEIVQRALSTRATDNATILKLCKEHDMPIQEAHDHIARSGSLQDYKDAVFAVLVKRSKEGGPNGGANGGAENGAEGGAVVDVIRDELTGRAAAISEALTIRVLASRRQPGMFTAEQEALAKRRGITDQVARSIAIMDGNEKPKNAQTTQYLGRSLVEIAAECIGYRSTGLLTHDKAIRIMERAFDSRNRGGPADGFIESRAFQSTSDFPAIFANVLNKALLARYQLAAPTYRQIAIERPFVDFRPHPQVRAGDFPLPQPLTEAGELRSGKSVDNKETVSVKPYGVIFPITRQMIVNDDLGAIDQILGSSGDATLIFENTTFFQMFNSNPVLAQDNIAVFANGAIPGAHNNYLDTFVHGSNVPNITTIGAARAALRAMKSLSGYFLNIPPSIILTGPLNETTADQMVTAIAPTLTTSVNPFSGRLRSVTDANITTSDWYIAAEPGQLPCFVYGFLGGATGPRIRTEEPFGVQGVRISLEHDFGCGAIDYRGFFRNSGLTS